MSKNKKKNISKAGLPPGTLIHVGERKMDSSNISVIDYNENNINEYTISDCDELKQFKHNSTVSWINLDGLHDIELVEEIGKLFDIHPLALEDVLNTRQRPKSENYDNCIFTVVKMLMLNGDTGSVKSEQVSLIMGKGFVISFQEQKGDVFDGIRARLRNARGKIRRMTADYLMYCLLDAVVDSYFAILEKTGDDIEQLESVLAAGNDENVLHRIHAMKRTLISLRKSIWPLREVVNSLLRDQSQLIGKTTGLYLRDVYDHTIQVIDTLETHRDLVSGLLDMYMSAISNAMNSVMKVLTIIATLFIPLTFIAGIYGMNFKYMPELEYKWAYPAVWVIMIASAAGMLCYFKKKKWI